jgi:uncharacterized protein YqgC (DUF456 family)
MSVLTILGTVVLFLFLTAGLGLVVLGMPGTLLILVSTFVYAWSTGFAKVTVNLLIALAIITAVAEGLDFVAGMWGARKYGSSKKAMVGALLGGAVGSIMLAPVAFGLGAIPGALIGSFGGAFGVAYLEKRKVDSAAWVGYGAFLGRLAAVILKGTAAVSMIVIDAYAIFA